MLLSLVTIAPSPNYVGSTHALMGKVSLNERAMASHCAILVRSREVRLTLDRSRRAGEGFDRLFEGCA
jgi:hypothetical protein